MLHTTDDWIDQYRRKNALWIHDGNPLRPHALLTSGKHSNGFFNSRFVIPDKVLLRDAASDLLELFAKQGGDISQVQGVVGPQTGATKLAELLSDQIMAYTRDECCWASPEKQELNGKKSMVFSKEECELVRGRNVLLCEDVITTGGSIDLTIDSIDFVGGAVMPFVLVLVNRSGLMAASNKKIIALIHNPMPMWTPDECPLCKKGSEAIRPKGKDEWVSLNASY